MSLVERLIPDIVRLLGVVTGLITAAFVLALICSRRGAAVRHGIWLCALIATLVSPLAMVVVDRTGLRLATITVAWAQSAPRFVEPEATVPAPVSRPRELRAELSPAAPPSSIHLEQDKPSDRLKLSQETSQVINLSPARATPAQHSYWLTALVSAGLTIWGVGALILLVRFLRGLYLLHVLRRSARLIDESGIRGSLDQVRSRLGANRLPPIATSSDLGSPVAVGLIRPLVILPEGLIENLSPTALGDVLVHEAAHILRHDALVGLLQRLTEMFYWPHPLVHLMNRRLARAREEICDNHVLKQGDPCEFARTLLALAERGQAVGRPVESLPLLNAHWKLEDRVAGLLDLSRKPMTRASRAFLTIFAVLMLTTGMALAGVRIEVAEYPIAHGSEIDPSAPAPTEEETMTRSAPSRSEVADLIRAIGRDPISDELVGWLATIYHPRHVWSRDFARMKQVATDPHAVQSLDALSREVQGKPLDTFELLRLATFYHKGYDDAMMKQLLREWIAYEQLPSLTIRGTVVDEVIQQPIPFSRVFSDDSMAAADAHGRFELKTRKKADTSSGSSLWVEADSHASGEFLVKQNDNVRIALSRDMPFFGKVVDHDGKPVEEAEVRARVRRTSMILGDFKLEDLRSISEGVYQVRTDSNGRFSFQGLPDRRFTEPRIMEEAFLTTLKRDREFNDPRWPFLIKVRDINGKTLIDATFHKRASGENNTDTFIATIFAKRAVIHFDLAKKTLQLTLEDSEIQNMGKPDDVAIIHHNLLEIPLPDLPRFRLDEEPIYLEVTHLRFQTSNSQASAPTRAGEAPLIRLEPGAGITGQVFDDRNQPVADAMIQVRDPERDNILATAFTDRESGTCRIPAILKPGRYTVVVQSATHAPAWRTIVAGEALSSHQFVLEPGGYITGKVVDQKGELVPGAAVGWVEPVSAEREPGRALRLNTTTAAGADGSFRLGPLPTGEFQITAIADSPRRQGKTIARVNGTVVIKLTPE